MTYEEMLPLFDGNNPVLFASGKAGFLIRLTPEENGCGVQIPGEKDMRWLDHKVFVHGAAGVFAVAPSPHLLRVLRGR